MKDKIEKTIQLLKKGERLAIELNPDGYYLGFSGGKDSQVLLDLTKIAGVRYKAYYNVTTNDPPENVYFIRKKYPEVTFTFPKRNFFALIEKKGLPTQKRRYCCAELKENNGAGYVVITGVRADESINRSKYEDVKIYSRRKEHADRSIHRTLDDLYEANHRCVRGKDKIMIYPLLHWKTSDIWQYIHERNLPINPCYQRAGRVGCMFCPFSNKRQIEYYEKQYPKYRENILASIETYLSNIKNKQLASAEDYYEWWKTKKSIKEYLFQKRQLTIW